MSWATTEEAFQTERLWRIVSNATEGPTKTKVKTKTIFVYFWI